VKALPNAVCGRCNVEKDLRDIGANDRSIALREARKRAQALCLPERKIQLSVLCSENSRCNFVGCVCGRAITVHWITKAVKRVDSRIGTRFSPSASLTL
jgi:hypothetical protein